MTEAADPTPQQSEVIQEEEPTATTTAVVMESVVDDKFKNIIADADGPIEDIFD